MNVMAIRTVTREEPDPESHNDAEDDGELLERDEGPAHLRRAYFGDVERGEHAQRTDADAAHGAPNEEMGEALREALEEGANVKNH